MAEGEGGQFPVVGIGASAGGIEAFRAFFEHMPADSGLAFVVVLHLPVDGKSILPELLARWTSMPVVGAAEGCVLQPDHVYVPPSGGVVTVEDSRFHLHPLGPDERRGLNPITILFNSLAATLGEDAIGIVLSGTGNDGALGLKAIKENGGLTLVQGSDGSGPQHEGMPSSAIATGAVDIVAPAEAMPAHLVELQRARRHGDQLRTLSAEELGAARLAICTVLNRQLGHDFSGYKDKTFMRRVQRRMQVLGIVALDAFIARLRQDRGEVVMLFRDLLIGVTSFFRDEDTFAVLKNVVIPRLFANRHAGDTIRVWVPGCATGEEAYSLAMLLREYAEEHPGELPAIQVFATDIDEAAIGTARAGRYPSTLLQGLSAERLSRFFVHGIDSSYTVAKSIRELCTFSAHSLTRDPPFSRIDLLSCRNLLIYLDTHLQSVVIPAFHYALAPDGILLLGSSETINRHEALFATLDRPHRIFQKRNVASPPLPLTGRVRAAGAPAAVPAFDDTLAAAPRAANWASSRVLERFAPAFLVVDAKGRSVQYSNRVSRFLELPPGLPNQSVLSMARRGLQGPLRAALRAAAESGRAVERTDVTVLTEDGETRRVTLFVEPRRQAGSEPLFLVVFAETSRMAAPVPQAGADDADNPVRQYEAELRDAREQLQSITEEHDTALEELRSANEELHSLNEELQSTNEELETSKEEIQSINEELQTVNGQLAGNVDELDRRNSDLQNLFESTQVATVFLDPYLVVRSFTPAIATIYNLIPSDRGRPLTDIVSRLDYAGLREDCRQVLQTLKPLERRIAARDGSAHYLMRILPYRTPASTVDGTIVTFVDVTSIVQAEQHQRLLVDELNHRVKNMLTVVISLATQTMRRASTAQEFADIFMGRIHALTAAYSLVSNEGWLPVSLRALLVEELRPFRDPDHANVVLRGPPVALDPRGALALGMAVHELTTNAVKYGALSVPEGVVTVGWNVEQGETGELLVLDWVESNGPRVEPPTRRGFGSVLIERGLKQDMSATVELNFAPEGLRARLAAPLPVAHAPEVAAP